MDTFKRYLPVLLLVLIFGAAFQSPNSVPCQLAAIQSEIKGLKPRNFYLTRTKHTGAQALTACAAGYHMASLWEIHEPAILRYDTDLGLTADDSGFGPPTGPRGWIRTGVDSNGANVPGPGNCKAWTSADSSDPGTTVSFPISWGSTAERISPLISLAVSCAAIEFVWCVQD